MRAVIIDDEKQAIASLQMELAEVRPKVEIIGTANSVESGLKLLAKMTPDVLFLDIRLKDGLGFDLLTALTNFGTFRVVFTTAYDQYALKAFKHGVFDYLLKPVDQDDLQSTVNRILSDSSKGSFKLPQEQIDHIIKLPSTISAGAKIALNTTDGIYLKKIEDIIHIQAYGNYTKLFLKEVETPMVISKTLKDFEHVLKPARFVRIHTSHLINLAHLDSFHNKSGGYVVMSNGINLPVSERKKSNLMAAIK
ncbi:MAG: response regulator [Bacteroidetes bacterium]|jgi:two-component system LytT family response regulator|nr:response regulator [Bacteroidota bacterium]